MRTIIDIVKKLNYILEPKHKAALLPLFIIVVVGSFVQMLSISVVIPVIYVILDPDAVMSNRYLSGIYYAFDMENMYQFIILMLVAVAFVYLLKLAFLLFRDYYKLSILWKMQREIADKMMVCYMRQPYSFHALNNSASIQRKVIADVGTSMASFQALIDTAVNVINSVVLLALLLYTDVASTIAIGIVLGIVSFGFMKPFSKKLKGFGEISRQKGEEMIMWVNQSLGGIKEVKVRENEDYFVNKFSMAYKISADAEKLTQFLPGVPGNVLENVILITLLGVIGVKLSSGMNTTDLVTMLATLALAGMKLLSAFSGITGCFGRVYYTKPSLDALYEDLHQVNKLIESDNAQTSDVSKAADNQLSFHSSIELKNISFAYPDDEKKIFEGIDLSIKKGESIAIIGPSGAGKTTLADIILGLLEPQEGGIYVDGIPVADKMKEWHGLLGYIPQNLYLLDDTIKNNILFGIEEKDDGGECLRRVIEDAQLKEYIETLDKGIDTVVGERGARISGGQMQRISIARALYMNPEILILDEATSALDNDTEEAVMESIDYLKGKLTLIIIAHRLSTIRNCDHIYEVKNGNIREVDKDSVLLASE